MRLTLLTLFCLISHLAYTQTITDCSDAQVLCTDDDLVFNPDGSGIDDFANPNNIQGCIVAGESNSAWYYFEIDAGAPGGLALGFTISPNGGQGEDYDWALFGPNVNCENLGAPIRCSSSDANCAFCPETGMGMGTTDFSEGPGTGDGFVSMLNVSAGQGFFLLIDNWAGTNNGFVMTWTGNASVYLNCAAEPPCALFADAGSDVTDCEDNNSNTFSLTGSSGGNNSTETYSWSGTNGGTAYLNNPSLQNPTVTLPPGFSGTIVYTLQVDEGSCMATDDITVSINPLPIVTLSDPGSFCQDDTSFPLAGSPGGGTWTGAPGGNFNPSANGPGTYPVTYSYTDGNGCANSASINITVNSNPTVSINPTPANFCTGDGGTVLTAIGASGGGGYQYNWVTPSGNPTGSIIPATIAGPYIVVITDANGCTSTAMTDVTEYPVPGVLIVDPGSLCASSGVETLQGNPGGGVWSGPNVTPSGQIFPSVLGPGDYDVTYTYTNVFGCSNSDDFTVNIIASPSSEPSNNGPYCAGETIELIGNTNGTGSNITYSWVGPNGYTSSVQNPSDATESGAYVLQVSISGCASSFESTTVDLTPMPDATASNDGPYCPGQVIQLNGSTSTAGTNISYSWTGPNSYASSAQNPSDATESGTYNLLVTVDGCESSMTNTEITFNNAPDATASNTGPYCTGEAIELSASTLTSGTNITYSWTGPGAYTSSVQNPTDATVAGTYSVVIDVDGCESVADETIIVFNTLPEPTITGDLAFCDGNSIDIDAGGTYSSYEWDDGTMTQTLTVENSGTFSVTVTDANGCTGEDDFTTNENPNPDPTITGSESFCTGATVSLDAGGPYNAYVWDDTSVDQTLTINSGATYAVTVTDANGCTGEDDIVITENMAIPPDISGMLEFCEGSSSLLDAGDYNAYLWTGGTNDQTLSVNSDGNYSVTVTDANGCTAEDQVAVVVNTNPTVSITGDDTFCEGETSTLSAGSFDQYSWTGGSSGSTLEVNTLGTVGVTVTDVNGCMAEDEINITVNSNPSPTIAGSTSFCAGSATTLDAGENFDTYLWSDGTGDQLLEVSTTGDYSVIVTDANGCTGEASTMVDESTSLNPVISGDIEYCVGSATTLDAGAGFSAYEWTGGAVSQTLEVSTPGNYAVTVSDGSGCTGEVSVLISENTLPVLSITGDEPICTGENITLDAGGGFDTYTWSDLSLNQTLVVNSGGPYAVTVTDDNGCSNEGTVNITENSNPIPEITGDQSFCIGEMVTLETGTYNQYQWSDGSGDPTLTITNGGPYSVIVTDANGCTGEDQFTVTENQVPVPSIVGDLDYCAGEMVTIGTSQTYTNYDWSNGGSTQSIDVITPGNINLIVTDANGCTGSESVVVIENPNPVPTIAGSITFCTGTSTIIDAGMGYDQYQWSNGSANQTLDVSIPGPYTVIVTDANGCSGTANIDITESQSLEPVVTGNLNLCDGEVSELDAGLGFASYAWSSGEMVQMITASTTDDYTVTVSDSQGCTGETTVSLVVNANPVATISGDDAFCTGDMVTLDAGPGFTYAWANGPATQTIDVIAGNSYTVTVSNASGCTDEATFMVTENPVPVIDILGATSFCTGNSVTLDAGANYANYFWSDGSGNQTVEITAATVINVIVTDVNGCTGTDEVTITENASLSPAILGDLTFCENNNTTLDAGGGYASYEWSTGDMTQNINIQNGGSYTVIVTDADGCSGSDNVNVTEFTNPVPVIAGSTTFCTGGFTTLDAGSFSNYSWSDGSMTQTITANAPGNFIVNVIDQNGCPGQAMVDVTESTSLNPVISGDLAFCENGNTILDAGAGFDTYMWSGGSSDQTFSIDVAGNYSVTVSDGQGCSGETTVNVSEVFPPEASVTDFSICNTTAGGSVLNLYDLVLSGDLNGTWEDMNNSGAVGLFTDLNFNNITAGDYNFLYTTNSATAPCTEVTYPVLITVMECTCADVQFLQADPLCNGDGMLDLTSIENTTEPGNWSIIQSPPGFNPATVSNNVFDATNGDIGTYTLQFQLTGVQPPGCPQDFMLNLDVDPPAEAGNVAMAPNFCQQDDEMIDLNSLIMGGDQNGVWTETSVIPSSGNAFDPSAGSFGTALQSQGSYTFMYSVASNGACPDDFVEVEVIINALPTVEAGAPINLDCLNPVNSLNGAGSSLGAVFDVVWSGPGVVIDGNENTLTPTIDASGLYVLTINNSLTGCMQTDLVQVTDNFDNPVISAGSDETLNCDDNLLNLQASGDIASPFQLQWNGPGINTGNQNSEMPEINIPGTYILTVSNPDNGCESVDTVIINEDINAPDIFIQSILQEIDCNTPTVSLTAESPTPNVSFEWLDNQNVSIGNTAVIDDIAQAGTYTVLVTSNDNGCVASEIMNVVDNTVYPIAEAGNPSLLNCLDLTANLDGTGSETGTDITYQWAGPGISSPSDQIMSAANLPGTYTLTVTNTDNGCTSEDQVEITEDIQSPIVSIDQPTELDCTTEEVTVTSSGSSIGANFMYTWTDVAGTVLSGNQTIDVQDAGAYTLVILNTDNGCEESQTILVNENTNVPNGLDIDIFDPNCFGDTDGFITINEVIGGTAPYSFALNGTDFNTIPLFSNLPPGTYDLTIQDDNGCELDEVITINETPELIVDLGTDLELNLGDSAIIEATLNVPTAFIDTIIWTPADLINCGDPGCFEIGFTTFNSLKVSATVLDLNGCTDEATISVRVDKSRDVFIPTAFSPNGDGFNDEFTIYANESQIANIPNFRVFNRWGELVFEALNHTPNDNLSGWNGSFKGEVLNPGVFVYLAEIEFIDGRTQIYKGDVTLMK